VLAAEAEGADIAVRITADCPLLDPHVAGKKVQMEFYAYLLKKMDFDVSETAYCPVFNADRGAEGFFGKMNFSETFIPYIWSSDWVSKRVSDMADLINKTEVSDGNPGCKNCSYAKQRAAFETSV